VFPAAILQPPFFDMNADDAVNYGSIGGTIGHEIGHGFDDKGSTFDGDGVLRNWWTDADRAEFDARTARLVDQYSKFKPFEDLAVNGEFTLGENIGDLGGLAIALKAYELSLDGAEAPVLDGFTVGTVHLDEAARMDELVYGLALPCLRHKKGPGQLFVTTTPPAGVRHWVNRRWGNGMRRDVDGRKGTLITNSDPNSPAWSLVLDDNYGVFRALINRGLCDVLADKHHVLVARHLLGDAAGDRLAIGQFRHSHPPSA